MFYKQRIFLFLTSLILATLACQFSPPVPVTPAVQAKSGDILFQDDFTDPSSGWEHFGSAEGIMDYDGSGYRFLVNASQTNFWSSPGKSFGNVQVEVDVAKLSGPDENRMGLLCRYSEGNYYVFMISSDGYYTIAKYINGEIIQLGQNEMRFSGSIHTGLAINHLRADCIGTALVFYINDELVAQTQDGDLAAGDIGLLAGSFKEAGVDVIFDNFVVIQP